MDQEANQSFKSVNPNPSDLWIGFDQKQSSGSEPQIGWETLLSQQPPSLWSRMQIPSYPPHFPQSNRNSDYSIIVYRTINVFNDKINLTTQVNGIFFIELEKYSDEKQNSLCVKHSLLEFAPETSIKSISSGNPSFNSKR